MQNLLAPNFLCYNVSIGGLAQGGWGNRKNKKKSGVAALGASPAWRSATCCWDYSLSPLQFCTMIETGNKDLRNNLVLKC